MSIDFPSQIAADPGSEHHGTARGKASGTGNPPKRGASSCAATPGAAADADAVEERWSPRPTATGDESQPGTGGIDGSGARIWELGFRAPAGLRRVLASSRGNGEERGRGGERDRMRSWGQGETHLNPGFELG